MAAKLPPIPEFKERFEAWFDEESTNAGMVAEFGRSLQTMHKELDREFGTHMFRELGRMLGVPWAHPGNRKGSGKGSEYNNWAELDAEPKVYALPKSSITVRVMTPQERENYRRATGK